MTGRIFVLGAAGRLGFAAAAAFRDAGWGVKGLVRPGAGWRAPRDIEVVETIDRAIAVEAGRGVDVVLNALNPEFTGWAKHALPLTYSAIEIAETAGATLMFPGNVYNYGPDMPEVLDEHTPMRPSSRKGRLRVQIEERMREASDRGMRTVILRAGDFFGHGRGSWFDLVVVKEINRGRVRYPGPLELTHAWAYVPDLVRTFLRLAEMRDQFDVFETFGFPGHPVTGHEFVEAIARAAKRPLQYRQVQWWTIHSFGRLFAMGRELSEMGYLWKVPHRISGDRLTAAIGSIPHTPLNTAVAESLRELKLIA
jgi:nucleoside-diphosphate-sugar epimerase